ncbi:Wadjet anti-phage system protein JetD domain-containing protein [Luteimonas sp. TWI1437]|uniref:Wadjet anti-phage system protein JetD domain-containing protein n=1 Tax=unclassified Luteimonas TaxID=2629088 RepID=UPI00320B3865
MSAARHVLERLLRKGERACLRAQSAPASLPMTGASAPEYLALSTLSEQEDFHAQIRLAEREGAISVRRDQHRDDGQRLLRLTVRDLDALARHLGIALLATRMADAKGRLVQWLPRFPVISEVLDAWAQGKGPGHGPESAADLADAARVVEARLADAGAERMLRRESVRLLGDSKRLEALTPWLALLVGGELNAGALEREHVWSALGLRREPQPMLIAGTGTLVVDGTALALVRPYLGVPVERLDAVVTEARFLLTVENLASFHDAAACDSVADGLVIYTGGMPSPAWRRACARVLQALPADAPVYHWGDIDEGGFRIAATLVTTMRAAGRVFRPWLMSPDDLSSIDVEAARRPSATQQGAMLRWAQAAGWPDVGEALAARPMLLEQEALRARLPAHGGALSAMTSRHSHDRGVDPV